MSEEQGQGEVTILLSRWAEGEQRALDELAPLVYGQLHASAGSLLRNERSDHTLQPTALVNEIFGQLLKLRKVTLRDRGHFYSFAARLMRRVLIDHARRLKAERRRWDLVSVPLEPELAWVGPEDSAEVLDLAAALDDLAALDPEKARSVELRYFLGCTVPETAAAMDVSPSSVDRNLRMALAWLYNRLNAPQPKIPADVT
jgi:RNA polymerase sigma factor (TIGR02999 family)